ncbi:aspartyl-tRNA(Asn)/glutamyl-tRNA(Gln) amidotransferase subunit A [Priestia aryabhattai B8W22]|uniref:Asp-tRNA(Asn)/Glu-tRNA(Gln) amidotransferase GatCAB subunit A n=1 Tax=Priestia aryabhattai TaxID=412384 RepID=UPI00088455F8|nr:aspartyl-tRNA(Asn)/glutamyl-tRNA(Gln) amidotransferase subunit A [Priestia aryabhattai B8W22]
MDNLLDLSIAEVSNLIDKRKISPVDLAKLSLERINQTKDHNAFISVYEHDVLRIAKAAESMICAGNRLGVLHGIPIALKDNIGMKGRKTTAGSKVLSDWTPNEDATVVKKLKSDGANIIGKTNMHEFAWGGTSDNPHYGTVKNAWDITRFPAGSSGGSGVAVAAGASFGALGTDTGGSIRLPSSLNGIVGIRPTIGRVSNYGVIPLAWSMDTVGPMTKTVEDAALMLNVIAGYDGNDDGSAFVPVEDYTKDLKKGVKGLRIGIVNPYFFDNVQESVLKAFKDALSKFKTLGARIEEVNIKNIDGNITAQLIVEACEPSAYHQKWLREQPESYGEDVRILLELGELHLATHYIQAQRYRSLLRKEFVEAFKTVDVFICPTLPFTATELGETKVTIDKVQQDVLSAIMQFTGIPSLAGLPGLNVPCGFDDNGLPIGMQIIGKPFDEGTLFRVGQAFQDVTEFHKKSPFNKNLTV